MPDQFIATRRWLRRLLLAASLTALASPGWAGLPLAGQHYPNGAEDFVIGALPPPGVYFKNYTALIQKERLMDNDGKKFPTDFKADVGVLVPRFIWVSPYKVLGASWTMHAFFPLYQANVETTLPPNIGRVDHEDSGLGDIIFSPFVFGWHFSPNFHMVAAVDFFLPTGDYDSSNLASQVLSKNSWTIEPVLAASYLRNGFDASIKLMYDFNTTNDEYMNLEPTNPSDPTSAFGLFERDLKAGQSFHFDWGLSYAKVEGWRFGLAGYNEWQTTDDEIDGDSVDDSKLRIGAVGPSIKYWPNQGRFSVVLKHLWEYGGKNTAEGQNTWLNAVWVF